MASDLRLAVLSGTISMETLERSSWMGLVRRSTISVRGASTSCEAMNIKPEVERRLAANRRTVESYDRHAGAYCAETLSFSGFPGLQEEILTFLSRLKPGAVLDLGTGSGRDAHLASKRGFAVVALDRSRS